MTLLGKILNSQLIVIARCNSEECHTLIGMINVVMS